MRKGIYRLLIFTLALQICGCASIAPTGPVSESQVVAPPTGPLITATPLLPATASLPPNPTETTSPIITPSLTSTATLTPTLTASPTVGLFLLPSEPPVFLPATPTAISAQNKTDRRSKSESCT